MELLKNPFQDNQTGNDTQHEAYSNLSYGSFVHFISFLFPSGKYSD